MAVGIGCRVVILEVNENRIKQLQDRYKEHDVEVIVSNTANLEEKIKEADVLFQQS